ncbi:lariat debranching enzyme, C-terminal domain-containing protein [Annulohypoxylon moriforme]|nr:lariat debranching enzyme, C-terminal domain-containing protein [Annulohypoxylon moriforme]
MSVLVSRCTLRCPGTTQFLAAIGTTIRNPTTIQTNPFRLRPFSTTAGNQKKKEKRKFPERDMAEGLRVAVAGCGHGTLDALYASAQESCLARGWDSLDLFIIGGDFQAVRNAKDLSVMSVPAKYRELGDFPEYYSGEKKAPYLTLFVGGNHEAAAHLWELYYGGWVAPNIYYMGAANVLRFGPLRIAGMSGIYNETHYDRAHYERLPMGRNHIGSFYHTREFDVRKLLQLREQVDVVLSHDWPKGIEHHGSTISLFKWKPYFEKDSIDGKLGNPAAAYVMDRLRPAYWFSSHLHCKFPAIKKYESPSKAELAGKQEEQEKQKSAVEFGQRAVANPDEIDLDMDDEAGPSPVNPTNVTIDDVSAELRALLPETFETSETPETSTKPLGIPLGSSTPLGVITEDLRAQLPASFGKPVKRPLGVNPGQPVPPTIRNKTVRFLALDKCLPGRKYLQLCNINPLDKSLMEKFPISGDREQPYVLEYDPEWLAVTRAFAPYLEIGKGHMTMAPPDLGEEVYRPMIDKERTWVEQNIVDKGKLAVPHNFVQTARPHIRGTDTEFTEEQPDEHTNPQTTAFCELLGVPHLWDASPEDRARRKEKAPKDTHDTPRFTRGGGFAGSRGGGRPRGRRG